jgi:hypothetical protein
VPDDNVAVSWVRSDDGAVPTGPWFTREVVGRGWQAQTIAASILTSARQVEAAEMEVVVAEPEQGEAGGMGRKELEEENRELRGRAQEDARRLQTVDTQLRQAREDARVAQQRTRGGGERAARGVAAAGGTHRGAGAHEADSGEARGGSGESGGLGRRAELHSEGRHQSAKPRDLFVYRREINQSRGCKSTGRNQSKRIERAELGTAPGRAARHRSKSSTGRNQSKCIELAELSTAPGRAA